MKPAIHKSLTTFRFLISPTAVLLLLQSIRYTASRWIELYDAYASRISSKQLQNRRATRDLSGSVGEERERVRVTKSCPRHNETTRQIQQDGLMMSREDPLALATD